uniref:Glycogen synthase kinase-3 n=1 Tax=Ascaris suum TaxID=6253 RepID=F1L6G3_ASCSU
MPVDGGGGSSSAEINQVAELVENGEKVMLKMKELSLFSNGVFSNVYKGKLTEPQSRSIAIKKSWSREETVQRPVEVRILNTLNQYHHKNIIELLYIFGQKHPDGTTCTALVFEFFPMNLHDVRVNYGPLGSIDVKLYTWQLFRGQAHLEQHHICHRDIKPQNLLVDHNTGVLKISDFGSSKVLHGDVSSYNYHVTRYYRAPELILGSSRYRCEIDRWSCGCVFGELLKNHVLLPGRSTNHQLQLIIEILGFPTDEDVKAMRCTKKLLQTSAFKHYVHKMPLPNGFQAITHSQDQEALKLLRRVLVYNPIERLHGVSFLADPYFNDLFTPGTKRNGKPLSAVTQQDKEDALNGDEADSGSGSMPLSNTLKSTEEE